MDVGVDAGDLDPPVPDVAVDVVREGGRGEGGDQAEQDRPDEDPAQDRRRRDGLAPGEPHQGQQRPVDDQVGRQVPLQVDERQPAVQEA